MPDVEKREWRMSMYRCFCGDSQCAECGTLQDTITEDGTMQPDNNGLALLAIAIAYAAFRRLGPTPNADGSRLIAAGWEFNGWHIAEAEKALGIREKASKWSACDYRYHLREWHYIGHRMRAMTVRVDFGGQLERVEVDWRELRGT